MTDLLKPKQGADDNYRVTFGPAAKRSWVEATNTGEASIAKLVAEAAFGATADVVIERMIYAIYRKEPDGEADKIWDYCYNRSDAMELRGLIWNSVRYNNYQYYWEYVTRETLEQQI